MSVLGSLRKVRSFSLKESLFAGVDVLFEKPPGPGLQEAKEGYFGVVHGKHQYVDAGIMHSQVRTGLRLVSPASSGIAP